MSLTGQDAARDTPHESPPAQAIGRETAQSLCISTERGQADQVRPGGTGQDQEDQVDQGE